MNAKKEEEKIKVSASLDKCSFSLCFAYKYLMEHYFCHVKQEKLAKKEAAGKMKLKENNSVSNNKEKPLDTVISEKKTRGAKRQTELLSPTEKTDTTSRKRLRKNNLSQDNILNVLDEKELQKRAAHVGFFIPFEP